MDPVTNCVFKPLESQVEYNRHDSEKTLLYQIIQNHIPDIPAFFDQCGASDRAAPFFVRKEFEGFLRCSILAHGFARVYCIECQFDRLVAFAGKRRGFCPSCMARRMAETAAHIVDSVIPAIPTRQRSCRSRNASQLKLNAGSLNDSKIYLDEVNSGFFLRSLANFQKKVFQAESGSKKLKIKRPDTFTIPSSDLLSRTSLEILKR
jgi:hypothetical protein